jgi:hypothetical protein
VQPRISQLRASEQLHGYPGGWLPAQERSPCPGEGVLELVTIEGIVAPAMEQAVRGGLRAVCGQVRRNQAGVYR